MPSGPQSCPPPDRRRQLLEVSLELFGERGYHGTTVADIIERAGVARGTFYNYFDSKRQIFGTLTETLFESVNASVRQIDTSDPSTVPEQVRANIAGLCQTLMGNLPMARVLLEQAVGLDAEANEQLQSFYDRVLTRFQRSIEHGQAIGVVRSGNSAILATCFLGMVKETLFQQLLGTRAVEVDELVDEIYAFAAFGVLAFSSGS